jgi:hypothetical protein
MGGQLAEPADELVSVHSGSKIHERDLRTECAQHGRFARVTERRSDDRGFPSHERGACIVDRMLRRGPGSGTVAPCPTGLAESSRQVTLDIPPGIRNGLWYEIALERIRISNLVLDVMVLVA